GMTMAQNSQREAMFMYEMSSALSGLRTEEVVAHALANNIQLMFKAELVEVCIQPHDRSTALFVSAPPNVKANGMPDRILPILAYPGLMGEIRIWRGDGWLPAEGSRLLSNFTTQAAQALERAHLAKAETQVKSFSNKQESES
ncbi:MAG TPA: hypothetical protein VLD65_06640, partial [Anaerolineales bacterium]|nr:hypothetical protein [Anaerolineales bacterium]